MTNATSHLVWLALWKRTCSPKVEWRTTLAQNVVSHLVNQDTWGAVWSLTLGRKYTNFQNDSFGLAEHLKNAKGATSLQSQNQAFPNICSPTVERGIITVKSVGVHSAEQGIWKGTCYLTVVRSHTSAHYVIMHVPTLYVITLKHISYKSQINLKTRTFWSPKLEKMNAMYCITLTFIFCTIQCYVFSNIGWESLAMYQNRS